MTPLLLLACSSPAPAPAPEPLPQGALLWVSEEGGAANTVLGTVEAKEPQPLVKLEGSVFPGPPDPQGTHALLVHAVGEGPTHLETLLLQPLDGGNFQQLSPAAPVVRNPSWSADGSRIYYESSALSFRDLYSVDRLGRVPKRLTEAEHGSFEPVVHGETVVFASSRSGNAELYSMALDGSDVKPLTQTPSSDTHPRWAPNGRTLTWLSRRGPDVSIWRMDPDGSHAAPFRLKPRSQEIDRAIDWAPDSSRVVVTVQTGPDAVVLDLLDPSGALVRRIQPKGVTEHPTWSPDSRWIVFNTSTPDHPPELYRLDVREPMGAPEQLTSNTHADWLARWLPTP